MNIGPTTLSLQEGTTLYAHVIGGVLLSVTMHKEPLMYGDQVFEIGSINKLGTSDLTLNVYVRPQ